MFRCIKAFGSCDALNFANFHVADKQNPVKTAPKLTWAVAMVFDRKESYFKGLWANYYHCAKCEPNRFFYPEHCCLILKDICS